MKRSYWVIVCLLAFSMGLAQAGSSSNVDWTLSRTVAQFMQQAPEMVAAKAAIESSKNVLQRAKSLENPTIEMEANNAMGKNDGKGGYDPSRWAITQPLGLSRRIYRQDVAQKELKIQEENYRYQTLLLQNHAATLFYTLQTAQAKYHLANERLKLADEALIGKKTDPVVRYLNPTEKVRLNIQREQAQQGMLGAKVEWEAALSDFRRVLGISAQENIHVSEAMAPPQKPDPLDIDMAVNNHPVLSAANYEREAAQARINLAKAEHLNAPEFTVYQERDFIGGQRETITGVGVSMQIPVWNGINSSVAKARADFDQRDAEYRVHQRDMESELIRQRMKLLQRIDAVNRFKTQLLDPTEKLLNLTQRSFSAGEADVLALIDAHNSYFEARLTYLNLMQEAWQMKADYNLAAGLPVIAGGDKQP